MNRTAERVASLGRDEFRRHLPYALRGMEHGWSSETAVEATAAWGKVTITVEELPPLALSDVFRLARLRVTLLFEGDDDAAWESFVAAYDRAFQRGGG